MQCKAKQRVSVFYFAHSQQGINYKQGIDCEIRNLLVNEMGEWVLNRVAPLLLTC